MATPVIKLCLIRGYKEAYYQLSEDEQKKLWDGVFEGIQKTGAKMIGPYYDCRWSNDEYMMFFLMEYPDAEAAVAEIANAEKVGLFRYMESKTILGVVHKDE